jgi:predicted RNA binding protein YcfA (HicA-like mRNA interferase family)
MTLSIELEQELDGRWIAAVAALPSVLSYGMTETAAVAKVRALALRASTQARLRVGWSATRPSGAHCAPIREGWPDYVFAFHDGDEIGPCMLSRIAKHTGLTPDDL